jgi:hypothetical protein
VKLCSLSAQFAPPLYAVAPGDHFVWPGDYIGRRIALPYATVDGAPIELITLSLSPRVFFIPKVAVVVCSFWKRVRVFFDIVVLVLVCC